MSMHSLTTLAMLSARAWRSFVRSAGVGCLQAEPEEVYSSERNRRTRRNRAGGAVFLQSLANRTMLSTKDKPLTDVYLLDVPGLQIT